MLALLTRKQIEMAKLKVPEFPETLMVASTE